jgi:hypothetical protein
MSTSIETKPQLGSPSDHWPPLAHIERKSAGPLREGKLALCGAKLMGIPIDSAHKVCEQCIKIARQELQGQ